MELSYQPTFPQSTISPTPNFSVNRPLDYLIFSNNAYEGNQMPLPEGWQLLSNIGENSGYQNAVFINPTTKEIVIAHRGTDFETEKWKDLSTDLKMFFVETDQENQAEAITKLVTEAYGKEYTIQHTGHSLGGFLAGEMALKFKQNAVTFDSPGIDIVWSKTKASKLIVNYQSAPNLVNKVPDLLLDSFRNPNTIQLHPDGASSLDNHSIYDYMRHFFDPNTGKIYEEPMLSKIKKALDLIRKYDDVIDKNNSIINKEIAFGFPIDKNKIKDLQKQNREIQSKIDQINITLNKINKPNYRKTLPQSENPNKTETEAVSVAKNNIISTKLQAIKFSKS